MVFGRSATAPQGLNINTTAANSFGGATGAASGTSLFGALGSTQTPASGGAFGASKPQQSGGLFGTASTQPQSSGGLFGNTTSSKPAASGGLFGSATTTQPQQSSSLFGASTTTNPPATGLFGATASTQPPSMGLFGTAQASQPQQQPSLFGAPQKPAGTSLFGALGQSTTQQQAQPQQSTGLFGQSAQQPQQQPQQQTMNNSLFNQSQQRPALSQTLNQSSQPQTFFPHAGLKYGSSNDTPATVPGVKIDLSNIRGTSRFSDLHPDIQARIIEIDDFITSQSKLSNEIDTFAPSHDAILNSIPTDTAFIARKVATLSTALENDAMAVKDAQALLKNDVRDAKLTFRALENLKLPAVYQAQSHWSSSTRLQRAPSPLPNANKDDADGNTSLIDFFSKRVDDMTALLKTYTGNMTEIESHLKGVEARTLQQIQQLLLSNGRDGKGGQESLIQELSAVLRDFEAGILGVAGKVGAAREGVHGLELEAGF